MRKFHNSTAALALKRPVRATGTDAHGPERDPMCPAVLKAAPPTLTQQFEVQTAWSRLAVDGLPAAIRQNARLFGSGSQIVHEGDEVPAVICVVGGWIGLSKSLDDGETQLVDLVLPGEFIFALGADRFTSALQVEAITDCVVATIPSAQWTQLKMAAPELESLRQALSGASRARIAERMLRLGRGSAEMRIAHALLELCLRLRAIGDGADRTFHIPLTQQQLGEFTGLSSVHVCRTLRRLERNGIIDVADHMDVRVINSARLAEIAKVDLNHLCEEILPDCEPM